MLKKNTLIWCIAALQPITSFANQITQADLNIPNTGIQTSLNRSEIPKPLRYGWDERYLSNHMPKRFSTLPSPAATKRGKKTLSIHDAIMLALRNNTDIINSDMTLIANRFSYETSMNKFKPQLQDITLNYSSSTGDTTMSGTQATLKTRTGASYTLGMSHSGSITSGKNNYSFSMTQALLRGFGQVADFSYQQSNRSYKIALLNYKSSIMQIVDKVTLGYWGLVQAMLNYQNTLNEYHDSLRTTHNTLLKYKAGQASLSEATEAKANLNSSKSGLITAKQSLQSTYTQYLQTIGLNIYSHLAIDLNIIPQSIKIPSLKYCIQRSLKNNIAYQETLLTLKTTQESIVSARDNRRWKLDLTATYNSNDSSAGSSKSPFSAGLSLTIPINDIDNKNSLIASRIDYEKAKISAQQSKINLIRQVTQDYRNIASNRQAENIAKLAAKQSQTVLNNAKLKLRYGKTNMFEVITDQSNLLSAQTSYVSNKITYLTSIQQIYDDMGDTLDYWNVKMRDLNAILK